MHQSVMLNESINALKLKEDSVAVDCTLGRAGHSSEILKRIKEGYLYAFDQDKEAIESSYERLKEIGDNFEIIKSNFVNLKEKLNERNIFEVDSILYDLGVSSPQLDEDYRGFSFHQDARLDMRMDQEQKLSAYEVVNNYDYSNLVRILREYGEEKYASSIANGIIKNRPIETTLDLVEVIKSSVPMSYKKDKHPARKTFQAIRIEVNHELEVLEQSLKQALELLSINGRCAVITFQSLEDKIVKKMFKEASSVSKELEKLPVIPLEYLPKYKLIDTIDPSELEVSINNRARSARLRIIERIR